MNTSANKKVRVGVVGVGSLGQHHARIYSESDAAELVGVYDADTARAAEIAAKFHTRAFESMDELASAIEAASVAVPTDRHFETSTALMKKGLHVLVEKPIAASIEQAQAMVNMAEQNDLILQVGHVERFNPVMRFLEDNLTQPRFIEASRLAPYPPPRPSAVPRGTEVSVVLDLMIHDLDIILHVVKSPVKEIHAVGVPVLSRTEDIANTRLVFANGCVANVTASRISQEKLRKIRVFQEDTYVSMDYMNQSGNMFSRKGGSISTVPVPLEKGEPLVLELTSFLRCVIEQRAPVVTGRHAYDALKLAIEICRQMRENPS